MASLVVRADRALDGFDAAQVWARVGDLTRFDEWFPVHVVGSMTGEAPEVGNVIFVTLRRSSDREHPMRLEVREWEAGTRILFSVSGLSGVDEAELQVKVTGEPAQDTARVELRFDGEVAGWRARVIALDAKRRFRTALDRLAKGDR